MFRRFEQAYADLEHKDISDISKETGCDKPCKYRKYRKLARTHYKPVDSESKASFGFSASTNYTMVGTNYFYANAMFNITVNSHIQISRWKLKC